MSDFFQTIQDKNWLDISPPIIASLEAKFQLLISCSSQDIASQSTTQNHPSSHAVTQFAQFHHSLRTTNHRQWHRNFIFEQTQRQIQ